MRNKLLCLLLAAVLTALTGCSLARPEQEAAAEDRWIGLYVVYSPHLYHRHNTFPDTAEHSAWYTARNHT